MHAEKRNSAYEVALSELETTLAGKGMVEEKLLVQELQKAPPVEYETLEWTKTLQESYKAWLEKYE